MFRGHHGRCGPRVRRSKALLRSVAALASVVIVSLGPGTVALAKKKSRTPISSVVKGLQVSPQELRIRVRALLRPTLGMVEESFTRLSAEASDPEVRRGALLGKIEMTGTLLSAMLRPDPVLALADAWGYVLQVQDLLAKPDAKARFGPYGVKASETLGLIDGEFREFVRSVAEPPFTETFPSAVRRWADGHPIEGSLYRRPSMDSAVAKQLATTAGGGVLAALGTLDETMGDVTTRMDLYTMYLPRMARWEAELAADDLTRGVDLKALSADLDRVSLALDRIAAVTETASDLAARERGAAVEALRDERLAVLDEVHKERIAVLDAVRKERVEALQEVEAIVQRLVDRSGGPLRDAVQAQQASLVSNVEEMRKRLMVDAVEGLDRVVDHAFFRLVQLLVICAALGVLSILLYAFLLRRREAPGTGRSAPLA